MTRPWRAAFDPTRDSVRHVVAPNFGHSLLGAVAANVFEVLGLSASLWEHGQEWFPLHTERDVTAFELEHGVEAERYAYNRENFAKLERTSELVRGIHGGYHDLFVPVIAAGRLAATLVVGPYATRRPTSVDILERWRWLTGRQGHPADPEFSAYLSATFRTLTLEGDQPAAFERLLGRLAALLAGEGKADDLTNEINVLRASVERARLADRMWETVEDLLDERTTRARYTEAHSGGLRRLGIRAPADGVLVGLAIDRSTEDPVDQAVRCDALQRRCVVLAQSMKNVLAGRIWDAGVVFLAVGGSASRRKQRLADLAQRAGALAQRQFGLSLHFGAAEVPPSGPVSSAFRGALAAAEGAAAQGKKLEFAELGTQTALHPLRSLRRALSGAIEERTDSFMARFDRYLEAVATHTGYRLEPARGHLEAGFERIAEPLLSSGALDERSYVTLCEALDRAATRARTLRDLMSAYRRAVSDVCDAVRAPVVARRDRSLRTAIDYIAQHYAEPLRLAGVARVSGLTASHFSKLFIEREGMPFERYVRRLRLERAQQLLGATNLNSQRIAELCGFGSVFYFHRVFRAEFGVTPMEYRRSPRRGGAKSPKARAKARLPRAKKTSKNS